MNIAVPDHRREIVFAAGSATCLLALSGVFALGRYGNNVMLWYGYYFIPLDPPAGPA